MLAWFDYGSHGVMRTDPALYYAFSRIGLTQGWTSLYDLTAQRRVYATMPGLWWFPLPYTPPMAWLTVPLTVLPLQTAYWVWTSMIAAAFVATWWLLPHTAPCFEPCASRRPSPPTSRCWAWSLVSSSCSSLQAWRLRCGA
jgi:hypothetical protein